MVTTLKAPFPWFGGKSKVASLVWERFGDVQNYVEPFFGSGAVLLNRKTNGGYASIGGVAEENSHKERIWFSPHCLNGKQISLFGGVQ